MKSRRQQSQSPMMEPQQRFASRRMGMSNSMMQERMRQQQSNVDQGTMMLVADLQKSGLMASSNLEEFMQGNVYKAMQRLVQKEKWDPEFAAAWLGQAIVETGNEDLSDLDVVERGSGRGRGMFQYTGARRRDYDAARSKALNRGQNVNDINWQIDYALDGDNPAMNLDNMREGLTDPNKNYKFHPKWGVATGKSPNGVPYKDKFSNANQLMAAYQDNKIDGYTRALTGEYTRAGEPHLKRREQMSKLIISMYKKAEAQKMQRNSILV